MFAPTDAFERLATEQSIRGSSVKRRALVIVNPYATTVSDRLRNLVVFALQSRYEVEAIDTDSQGHAKDIARAAADDDYEVVIAFGGDGTVNEVANGLVGSDTALTCLPGGSTNVYCRTLGIPRDIVEATEHLLVTADRWEPRKSDLGIINGRYFTFTSGIGVDALVCSHTESHPYRKAKLGAYYFTSSTVMTYFRKMVSRMPLLELSYGNETHTGISAVIQNSNPYTYFNNIPLQLTADQSVDSGSMSAILLQRLNPLDTPGLARRMFSKARIDEHRSIVSFPELQNFKIKSVSGEDVPVQVDGDYIGDYSELEYSIAPKALTVIS